MMRYFNMILPKLTELKFRALYVLGFYPLHRAIREENIETIKLLTSYKWLNINDREKSFNFVFPLNKKLIVYGCGGCGFSHCAVTPLQLALDINNVEIASLLIHKGANFQEFSSYVDDLYIYNYTPLARAISCGDLSKVKFLVKAGAELKKECYCVDDNMPDEPGWPLNYTPQQMAEELKAKDIIQYFEQRKYLSLLPLFTQADRQHQTSNKKELGHLPMEIQATILTYVNPSIGIHTARLDLQRQAEKEDKIIKARVTSF